MKRGAWNSRPSCALPFSTTLREELLEWHWERQLEMGKITKITVSSCCWTVFSSRDTWHKKKASNFNCSHSQLSQRNLRAESWLGDGNFRISEQRQSQGKAFPPHQTLNFPHSLYSRAWSFSVPTIPYSDSKHCGSPSRFLAFSIFLASKALQGLLHQ